MASKASNTALTDTALANRAEGELSMAQRAFLQANALFTVLQFAIAEGDDCHFDLFALTQIGQDLTTAHADRAREHGDFFREVPHV